MKYYGIKKRKAEGYSAERRGDRRSILFSYGQVEFERTYYKKASGGYEYLADTAVVLHDSNLFFKLLDIFFTKHYYMYCNNPEGGNRK